MLRSHPQSALWRRPQPSDQPAWRQLARSAETVLERVSHQETHCAHPSWSKSVKPSGRRLGSETRKQKTGRACTWCFYEKYTRPGGQSGVLAPPRARVCVRNIPRIDLMIAGGTRVAVLSQGWQKVFAVAPILATARIVCPAWSSCRLGSWGVDGTGRVARDGANSPSQTKHRSPEFNRSLLHHASIKKLSRRYNCDNFGRDSAHTEISFRQDSDYPGRRPGMALLEARGDVSLDRLVTFR